MTVPVASESGRPLGLPLFLVAVLAVAVLAAMIAMRGNHTNEYPPEAPPPTVGSSVPIAQQPQLLAVGQFKIRT